MADRLVIVAAKRSAFGRYLGSLAAIEPVDLAVQVARARVGPHLGEEERLARVCNGHT